MSTKKELTIQEANELEKASQAGDLQARQRLDEWARAEGYGDWAGYRTRLAQLKSELRKELEGDFDQVDEMIHAVARQAWNNSVLRAALGALDYRVLKEHVIKQMKKPELVISPNELPEIPTHPLKRRREQVRQLKCSGATRKEIAQEIEESEDIVKKDLEWLRKGRFLPRP